MQIDGDVVLMNDRVWHDRFGWGQVISVQQGVCDVRFEGSQSVLTFTDGGRLGGQKVLWWGVPYLFAPRKNVNYDGLSDVVSSVLKFKGLA